MKIREKRLGSCIHSRSASRPSLGQRVMRSRPRLAGLLAARSGSRAARAASARRTTGLGSELGVEPALLGHPHEIVRAGAALADEDEDDVRERGERRRLTSSETELG